MTEEEVVVIARYVRAVCPQQRLDEFTADAWFDFLYPYSVDETRTAIAAHLRRGNAFISIGEIIREIRKAREDRLARHTEALPPTGAHDDASYRRALLTERTAVAEGRMQPSGVPALPPGSETPEYEGRGRALLRQVGRESLSRRPEFAAPCPHCRAHSGQPCTNGHGDRRRDAHPTRIEASRALAAGEPAVDHQAITAEIDRRRAASAAALARETDTEAETS